MACYYPQLAVNYGADPITGKNRIKFISRVDASINKLRSKFGDSLLLLPCGRCLGCKFDKAKDWSTRVMLESEYYSETSFLTLTYDDDHLPSDNKLKKSDFQEFIKKLRNRGLTVRYFGCGEYGSNTHTHRPHYHIIVFGYIPHDLVLYSKGSQGDFLYTSEELNNIWEKGFCIVGYVTKQSAGYVARYTTKKAGDDDSFLLMSNRPGIGFQYLLDHIEQILRDDQIFTSSFCAPVPRYFDNYLRDHYPEQYQKNMSFRLDKIKYTDLGNMINLGVSNLEELKVHQAVILDKKLSGIDRM